ncbi:hypothetical protein GCK72_004792 [Caenorhabditis remanei]|uniref:Uncharacterized protein n=1 Tax=Caenorhabditis remanei TaxID=31234 RepID=A0A6A5HF31_CAERE|nr:hypothetical protein GCK72_004792 [Caenorhabditis remanei]KAF1764842.1 hypothetical protein GCK72_004792 [Caenorhabditis remanei]
MNPSTPVSPSPAQKPAAPAAPPPPKPLLTLKLTPQEEAKYMVDLKFKLMQMKKVLMGVKTELDGRTQLHLAAQDDVTELEKRAKTAKENFKKLSDEIKKQRKAKGKDKEKSKDNNHEDDEKESTDEKKE